MTFALATQVREALSSVDDPELGINIVDLGLVRAIEACGKTVSVTLSMTTPTCPLGGLIAEEAAIAIERDLGEGYSVSVSLDRAFKWTPDLAKAGVLEAFAPQPGRFGQLLNSALSGFWGRR